MTNIKVAYTTIFPVLILLLNGVVLNEATKRWRKNDELVKHDGTIKSIKIEDGYIIDCVDIYKQPAFSHPLLKNHTIKDGPPKLYKRKAKTNKYLEIFQKWQKKGRCPEKTIPIRRTRRSLMNYRKPSPFTNRHVQPNSACVLKIAGAYADPGIYRGAHTLLNVWTPPTELLDFSVQEMIVYYYVLGDPIETMEVGYHVNPTLYRDNYAHFFVYWTRDNYVTTGCYNLLCAGFLQTDRTIVLGDAITPTSVYNGAQVVTELDIVQEEETGDWYLHIGDRVVGYWPGNIFINLQVDATQVIWFGHVEDCNGISNTTTQMGSGHFAEEGMGRAAFFDEPEVIMPNGNYIVPPNLNDYITHPECYNLRIQDDETIIYGGPGQSANCP